MTWRHSMIPLYLSFCHSLLPAPHFLMFKENILIDFEIWRKINCFSGKENPRSLPFPHFPLYAALEQSAPTYCGKINILNQFVKETLKNGQFVHSLLRFWSSCQQISNLLIHMIPHLLQKHTVTSKSVSILSQASEKGNLMSFITSANKPPLHVIMYHIINSGAVSSANLLDWRKWIRLSLIRPSTL